MDAQQIVKDSALETLRMWHRIMIESGLPRAAVDQAIREFAAELTTQEASASQFHLATGATAGRA